ncbi:glutathione peroxidase [Plastoroseomonas arctica]|uniref:Glutathione peroxidase n=1 Tax=Plastoroseomonas arctica TaxID=1509237 RepID=A0AAF1KKM3_9PROT|nr:glutathione peroxidase [Plastoroseomonas arctica]MBR0656715.1 glutathione peroxidase [Plastoroseomonas arctica]
MADVLRRALLAAPLMIAAGEQSVFDFTVTRLEGGPMPLAEFRGQALLIVNTASFCGFTPQYAGLQTLHDRYKTRGFSVIGVPSNDFNQESTNAATIREFCDTQYGIDFPLAALSHVRGPQAIPLFRFLATSSGSTPGWNFHKYLVARDGRRITSFSTSVEPNQPTLLRAVDAALG